jgi:uncharacterized membrane protein HdeD (DUF308 family)
MLSFKYATATAILIGVLAFVWPGITMTTLVIFFGTYVFDQAENFACMQ